MDSKLLATIIAVAKKEAGTQARDLSLLERKVEDKLKEFHKRSPILDLPTFTVKSGSLYCTWSSGHTLDFGNIVGPQGIQGIQGVQGIQGIAGKAGTNGKDGLNGKDGYNGKDGTAGRNGIDGKQGLRGVVGARGEPGQDGKQGIPGNDGQAGKRGSIGLSGNDGLDGEDGEDGVGIEKAWVNDNYHLTIRLTSGKVIDAGYVRGNPGASAGKGGRVSGYSSGGSSASSPFLVNASFNSSNELILGSSNGSSINAGAPADPPLTWDYLVQNWSVEPALNAVITGGTVYNYTLSGVTRYRLVPDPYTATSDQFYSDFNGTTLSGLIVARGN